MFSDVASWTLTFRLVSSAAEHNEDDGEDDDDAATDAGHNDDDRHGQVSLLLIHWNTQTLSDTLSLGLSRWVGPR